MMNKKIEDDDKTYPKGHFVGLWMGIGIAIFSGIVIPLSIMTNNVAFIGIGPAIGVGVGLAIGQSIENKYQEAGKIRPLTEAEKRKQKNLLLIALALLVLGLIAFASFYFMMKNG